MINSGAITVANMLLGKMSFEEIQDVFRKVCEDPEMESNEAVFRSEMQNLSRNRAIAYLLQSKGILDDRVEETLELYTRLCSLQVTAVSLASMGMTIAMDGKLGNGESVFTGRTMEICKTIMLTCGMYDRSGRFAVKVGLPTKSGVGGGLVSVADNHVASAFTDRRWMIKGTVWPAGRFWNIFPESCRFTCSRKTTTWTA